MRHLKKSHIRDYATEAFRYFARIGKPSYEELKSKIYDEALKKAKSEAGHSKNISKPTEYAIIQAEKAVEEKEAMLLDILAVQNTLLLCEEDVKKAIELVYFPNADKPIEKGEICARVLNAVTELYASERRIYSLLYKARNRFAVERKLRM